MSAHAYWEYIQFQGRPVTVFTTVTGAASSGSVATIVRVDLASHDIGWVHLRGQLAVGGGRGRSWPWQPASDRLAGRDSRDRHDGHPATAPDDTAHRTSGRGHNPHCLTH